MTMRTIGDVARHGGGPPLLPDERHLVEQVAGAQLRDRLAGAGDLGRLRLDHEELVAQVAFGRNHRARLHADLVGLPRDNCLSPARTWTEERHVLQSGLVHRCGRLGRSAVHRSRLLVLVGRQPCARRRRHVLRRRPIAAGQDLLLPRLRLHYRRRHMIRPQIDSASVDPHRPTVSERVASEKTFPGRDVCRRGRNRSVLDRLSARARRARPGRRAAGDLTRPLGAQGRDRQGARLRLATLHGALPARPPRPRAARSAGATGRA